MNSGGEGQDKEYPDGWMTQFFPPASVIYTKPAKDNPPVEVFANGGRIWLAECAGCTVWASFRTPEDVDKLIAEMEAAKRQAWPEVKANATQ